MPKGVMVEHRSLVNYLHWVNDGLLGDTVHHLPDDHQSHLRRLPETTVRAAAAR